MCKDNKKPTPEEFSKMLKEIGFVESTHTYQNFYVERDIEKKKEEEDK